MSVNEAASAGAAAEASSKSCEDAGATGACANGAEASDDDYVPPPDLDHRCLEVVLEPPSAAVGQLTKAVVRLVAGVSEPQPPGANMPALDKVRWEARVPDGKWLPVPGFAKPFPWDPHTIAPPADLAGLTVRAAGVVIDPETDRPALEFEGPNSAGEEGAPERPGAAGAAWQGPKRRARPRVYVSPPVTVAVPPQLDAAARKAAAMPKFGFHCSIGSASNMRLVCLVTHRAAVPSERKPRGLVIEALAVPNSDKAPMVAVFRGVLHLGGPATAVGSVHRTSGTVCDQRPSDHVTLTLHVDEVEHLVEARVKAAVLVDPSHGPCGIDVVVRSSKDRDMVTLCLRAVHAAWDAAPAAAATDSS